MAKFCSACRTLLWMKSDGTLNQGIQCWTDGRHELTYRPHPKDAARLARRVEPGQHGPRQLAQGVNITARVCLTAPVLLRRAIALRTQADRILRYASFKETGDAEVNELEYAIGLDHDIARLQIAEDHRWLLPVQIFEHVTELHQPASHLPFGDRATPHLHGCQRFPFDKFHYQEKTSPFREGIVYNRQMGMV
jgi:hypothetical protein